MSPRATVVVPTHDHGPTLLRSIPSALAQTVADIEVFVIGDGAPDATREIVARLAKEDDRVRFFDNPKGPRHGEIYRHAALSEASGNIVCYLSDDDLWIPEHVEVMETLLEMADFAHSYIVRVDPDGSIGYTSCDLSIGWFRRRMLDGENFIPLSCGGHTLEMYRRLPFGWRTTPEGLPTDLYMWQQFLSEQGCRAASGTRPTVLQFATADRPEWNMDRRLAELDRWVARMGDQRWREEVLERVLDLVLKEQARAWEALQDARQAVRDREGRLRGAAAWQEGLLDQIEQGKADRKNEVAGLLAENEGLRRELEGARRDVETMRATRTWRLRNRLLRGPVVGPLLRWAGVARSRRARR